MSNEINRLRLAYLCLRLPRNLASFSVLLYRCVRGCFTFVLLLKKQCKNVKYGIVHFDFFFFKKTGSPERLYI